MANLQHAIDTGLYEDRAAAGLVSRSNIDTIAQELATFVRAESQKHIRTMLSSLMGNGLVVHRDGAHSRVSVIDVSAGEVQPASEPLTLSSTRRAAAGDTTTSASPSVPSSSIAGQSHSHSVELCSHLVLTSSSSAACRLCTTIVSVWTRRRSSVTLAAGRTASLRHCGTGSPAPRGPGSAPPGLPTCQ